MNEISETDPTDEEFIRVRIVVPFDFCRTIVPLDWIVMFVGRWLTCHSDVVSFMAVMAEKLTSESVVGMGNLEEVEDKVEDEDELLRNILVLRLWMKL